MAGAHPGRGKQVRWVQWRFEAVGSAGGGGGGRVAVSAGLLLAGRIRFLPLHAQKGTSRQRKQAGET